MACASFDIECVSECCTSIGCVMIDLPQHKRVSVLLLSGSPSDLEHLQHALPHAWIEWQIISQRDLNCLLDNTSRFDCVFVKMDSDAEYLGNIAAIRQHNTALPIIAIGSNWQVHAVVQAMKLGATEVCEFPNNMPELCSAFERSLSTESRSRLATPTSFLKPCWPNSPPKKPGSCTCLCKAVRPRKSVRRWMSAFARFTIARKNCCAS